MFGGGGLARLGGGGEGFLGLTEGDGDPEIASTSIGMEIFRATHQAKTWLSAMFVERVFKLNIKNGF